ncbi:DUF551 domain-containing protein [Klebsiella michiganensis]|uniref:DUF551 domain-containing protein n=1 Tax=Klebsiella michiganensis TaxID=1134687 RepID=UPI002DC008F6|nr:DUF551 domain-containing protein [Klebsiella michiganensis]MEB8293722.1 DUF551 domain-containing protein [Klebsiella michiganensis]
MTSKLTITDERLAELVAFKPLPGTDITSATRDEWMAMAAELQERRKAEKNCEPVAYMTYKGYLLHAGDPKLAEYSEPTPLYADPRPAAMPAAPVAWLWSRDGDDERDVSLTPPDDDADAADAIECGWTASPLYRHAQQPVVPDRSIFEKWWESQNGAPLDGWDSLRTNDGYCDDGIDGQFEAWNAAMLNHPSSIQPNTDATPGAEIKHPSSNSPVIPEWIPVSERMPEERETVVLVADERGIVWCAEIQDGEIYPDEFPGTRGFGCAEATHWMPLPVAPQEEPDGK